MPVVDCIFVLRLTQKNRHMKKIFLIAVLAIATAGCKSTSATGTKLDNDMERKLNGNWVLSSVSYPGSDYIQVNSFQLADSKCFEGSTWKFVDNNNKGSMSLNSGANCPAFSSDIRWFINTDGQFVLKVLNAGEKAKKVRDGYVLSVANATGSSFELIDQVMVGSKTTNVVYLFNKN